MAIQATFKQQTRNTKSPTPDIEMSHQVKYFSMENSILRAEHDVLEEIFESSKYGNKNEKNGKDNFAQKRFSVRVKAARIAGAAEGKLLAMRQVKVGFLLRASYISKMLSLECLLLTILNIFMCLVMFCFIHFVF